MPRALLLIALVSVLCVPSRAQSPLPSTVVSCPAESGPIQNPIFVRTEVWAQTVQIPGATSFQLEFGEVEFEDPSDAVIVTNPLDGEVQRLDQAALKVWGNRSAWFNGSTATVSLELAPGSSGSVRLESALALADAPGTDDICGSDNRVPSSDNRVCRLVINGSSLCTGWLISDQSIILSAGHCFGGGINPNVIAQFNVPPSTSTGGIVAPPVASQFPLDRSTLQFNDGGVGDDWAVARLHPNPNGISAGQIFSHFALPTGLVPLNMTGRLTGYGGDPTPDPTRNFVQQSSTDSLSFFPSQLSPISHQIDSQGGNSGGPLIMEGTNTAVGIHTHGGCSNFLGSNHGTSIYHQALNQAIAATIGCAGLFLADGVSFQVTCSPTVYSAAPVAGRWNVAAVSGGSDWDIFREGTGSTLGGSACDFLISNGNLGTVPSISGEIRRFSGSSTARAQFASAQVLGLGQAFVDSWTQTRVLKVYQVAVPSGTPSLNVSVAGDATLSWQLYRPGTFGALWATRGTNMIISGQAGGPQTTVVPPVSGTYPGLFMKCSRGRLFGVARALGDRFGAPQGGRSTVCSALGRFCCPRASPAGGL